MNEKLRAFLGKKPFSHFIRSVWLFPSLILLAVIILACLKVSGTSVGMYYEKLYGDSKDSALLLNHPRAIRSDEWGVNTPYVVSQIQQGFPTINVSPGEGQDISLTFDVPTADWSALFKPQNLPFFILPVENAFALKWWLLAALIIIASYAFILALLPGRYLLASLISLGVFLSPFVHWWYQAGTILPIAYGLFITTVALYIIRSSPTIKWQKLAPMLGVLGYLLTCYAFLLYIPFILPIALVVGIFLVGCLLNERRDNTLSWRIVRKKMMYLVVPIIAAVCLTAVYVKSHSAVLDALSHSVYPGQRTVEAGGFPLQQLLGGYFNMQLQDNAKALYYNFNQSEASNFILIFPFLIPLFAYLWHKTKKIDWRILLLGLLFLLFSVYLFVPFTEPVFNLLYLNRVPHDRLLIGIGVLNLLLIGVAIEKLSSLKKELPRAVIGLSTIIAFATVGAIGILLKVLYDGYIESIPKILIISSAVAFSVWLLLKKRLILAFGLLGVLSLVSVMQINPLYQGLGLLTNSSIVTSIKELNDHKSKWVVDDHIAFLETFPAVAGARSLSGVYAYPQLNVWKSIGDDPDTKAVYNRYAHVFFTVDTINRPDLPQGAYFDPPALDAFHVNADVCSQFLKEQQVRYVLTTITINSDCAKKIREIPYPLTTLSIYELTY